MAISDFGKHDGPNNESSSSGIHWGAIFGGAATAAAISLVLIPLGSALGFSSISVFDSPEKSLATFGAGWAIWLIVMQWLSSAMGGYLAGRLRVKWADLHSDEVFFRDTAHGFLAWAVATLVTVALVVGSAAGTAGTAAQAGATVAAGAAQKDKAAYYADSLYRGATTAPTADMAAETARILAHGDENGGVSAADRTYLAQSVAARTGLSQADAQARVNAMLADIEATKAKALQAAEAARKAAAGFSIIFCLSLVIGAFIASVSAALAGRLRDKF